ncbi:hypothetical protein [Bacillus sp. M6-12]|nr:hypothetical protein [Bacillus sp. M6-12]
MAAIELITWIITGILGLAFISVLWAVARKPHYMTKKVERKNQP